jgi:hypothetical protein
MRVRLLRNVLHGILASGAMLAVMAPAASGQSGPAFSTQTSISGVVGSTFIVLLPLTNSGNATAGAVTITSAFLSATTRINPPLPQALGDLAVRASNQLVLQFDSSPLIVGGRYLLTVRGSYQFGGATLGFAVNRFVVVTVPSTSAQNDLQRWVVLDAVRAKLASLSHVDQVAEGQELLTFVQSRPEFVASGIYPDSSSVWARFADGLPLIIGNDFYPIAVTPTAPASGTPTPQANFPGMAPIQGPAGTRSLPSSMKSPQSKSIAAPISVAATVASPTELPESSSVRLLSTLDQLGDPTVIANLTAWLVAEGYTPVKTDASVEGLKTVRDDGVFYFRTHGAFVVDATQNSVYGLWTSTLVTDTNFANYFASDDLEPTDSPLVLDTELKAPGIAELHYSITAKFMQKYWGSFSRNSLVYIDACDSNVDAVFKQTIFDEDASVYAGWPTNTGDPFAANTARLVFDRLLGANRFCPETNPSAATPCVLGSATPPVFPQRPFDYTAITNKEFVWHGLGQVANPLSKYFGTVLLFTQNPDPTVNPGSSFGLLAPSIAYSLVWESGILPASLGQSQLQMFGNFGSEPSSLTVTLGGVTVPFQLFPSTEMIVDDPQQATGDVFVTVRGHKSNFARLTEWQAQFTYTRTSQGGSNSTLTETVNLNPVFRADIRTYRPVIHDPPSGSSQVFENVVQASSGNYSCKGSAKYTVPMSNPVQIINFQWTGSGILTPFDNSAPQLPPTKYFAFSADTVQSNITMNGNFSFSGGPQACTLTESDANGPIFFDINQLTGLPISLTLDPMTVAITLPPPVTITSFGSCFGPPDTVCSDQFQWNSISTVANTAPNPKSAR